jgi:hypothetical protein
VRTGQRAGRGRVSLPLSLSLTRTHTRPTDCTIGYRTRSHCHPSPPPCTAQLVVQYVAQGSEEVAAEARRIGQYGPTEPIDDAEVGQREREREREGEIVALNAKQR